MGGMNLGDGQHGAGPRSYIPPHMRNRPAPAMNDAPNGAPNGPPSEAPNGVPNGAPKGAPNGVPNGLGNSSWAG